MKYYIIYVSVILLISNINVYMIIILGENALKVIFREVFKKKLFQRTCLKIIINAYIFVAYFSIYISKINFNICIII